MDTDKVILSKEKIEFMLGLVAKIKAKTASLEDYKTLISILISNNIIKQEDLDEILQETPYKDISDFYLKNSKPFVEPDYYTQSKIIGTLSGATFSSGSIYLQEEKKNKKINK